MGRTVVVSVLIAIFLAGCAHEAELVQKSVISTRSDVFQEIPGSEGQSAGATMLKIAASLKTHKPGMYQFGAQTHGTPDYRLVVNIDGQVLRVNGHPQPEYTDQTLARKPEEGVGVRYRFQTVLKISAGPHRIIVALPDDGVAIERTVSLDDGMENVLRIAPIYGCAKIDRKPAMCGGSSFTEGVRGLTASLNDKPVE